MESSTNQTKAALAALTETAPDAVTTVISGNAPKPAAAIRTAQEVVLQKFSIDTEAPLTSANCREIHRFESKQGGTRLILTPEVGRIPDFTDYNLAIRIVVAEISGEFPEVIPMEAITEDEKSKLYDLQLRYDNIEDQLLSYSLANVNKRVFDARDAVHAATAAGQDIAAMRIPTNAEVTHDSIQKSRGYTAVLVKMTREETLPLCHPILQRFNATVEEYMRVVEVADRWNCKEHGLAYVPSLHWRALVHLRCKFSIDVKFPKLPDQFTTPRRVLEGIFA